MENLQLLREAVANKTAKVLTVDLAKELKGRKIKTIYFGYRGQDGTDEFIIGEVISSFDFYKNLKESCYENHPKGFKNRAEYWESYMTPDQLKREKQRLLLLAADGRETYIYADPMNEGGFTCSDNDRFVYFITVEDEN